LCVRAVALYEEVTVDEHWMGLSIELARGARPHPNPRVGAVILDRGETIVGRGTHAGPGTPHAEVIALLQAGAAANGGTLYVTLEPCAHYGRTPPCTDAIIAAGIARVVIGAQDPDRRVSGRGIRLLRDAGIHVTVGVSEEESVALDPGYFRHRRTGLPYVTLKTAATLDGQIAAADGSSQWITSEEARLDAHRLRAEVDAVMVGTGTVLADDPLLTVRIPGYEGPQPLPVIAVGRRSLPSTARVLERNPIVLTPADGTDRVDLPDALSSLAADGILDILVESGPTLATSLLKAGLVDRVVLYFGSAIAGGRGRGIFEGTFETLSDMRPVTVRDVSEMSGAVRIEAVLEVD
jgi:diaminohydroxyphosphoribosylaminopyrimidine deaminase / 5-amino-6-(5-phosphoribosylamino)uracil reductase